MTVVCSVAAVFTNPNGDRFQITAKDRGMILDAPEWIKDTLMFKWLANDGSIKFVNSANKIEAENEPMKGLAADGKKIEEPVSVGVKVESEEKPKATTRKKTKKDDA